MPELNGIWLAAAALLVCLIMTAYWVRTRIKNKRRLNYMNLQWERQNKDFRFIDNPDDSIGPVRVRTLNDAETPLTEGNPLLDLPQNDWPKVLSLYVKAKTHEQFYGYDLMQSILNQGLVHGAMEFFHFTDGNRTLFSLTSTESPGSFNLDKMGAFKTTGLCLFLQPHRFNRPVLVFDQMVQTAQQIAEDLGGVIEDEYHHLLTPERLNFWRAMLIDEKHD